MSTPITAGMSLSVQNPAVKGVFEPIVMSRSKAVEHTNKILKDMFLESYNCVFCLEGVEETRDHLFLKCNFAKDCWNLLGLNLPVQCSFPEVILLMKTHLHSDFFLNAVILMCWTVWGARNDIISNGRRRSINNCFHVFITALSSLLMSKMNFPET